MKKLINRPPDVVEEMLQGLVILHPGSVRLPDHKALIRADAEQVREQQVAVLSGGGSGHEPAHAGYIGAGMLSAAIAGEVFTSPSSDSVLAAIKAVAGTQGALLIVKNYTGDRLNFGLAAEMARSEGLKVEIVLVKDDIALEPTATGARGLAGTVFVHKLVGAAAAEGKSLAEVAALGRAAAEDLATMGVSFSAGVSPAVGKPSFELGENEIELGLGIHGEPGVQRTRLQPADQLVETLLTSVLRHDFNGERRVAVMLNNLGATTEMELAIVARHAVPFLEGKGFKVERIYGGTFLSSLDMAGISISLLAVDEERLRLLDAATTAPAWPNAATQRPGKARVSGVAAAVAEKVRGGENEKVRRAIESACRALRQAENRLTELDRVTGDGDLGMSMERAAKAVLGALSGYPLQDVPATLKALGNTLRRALGGSSGPLYGVLFLRCGSVLEATKSWHEALVQGCEAVAGLGGAKAGDRTMLDALLPFAERFPEGVEVALQAAERGAAGTAQMTPRLGRSSYLGERVLGHPDPGAVAVSIWLRAVCDTLQAT